MKKCIKFMWLCVIVLSLVISSTVFAGNEIKVVIDGEQIDFDVPPQIMNDRTMVPLRAIFEALGAEVEWDGDTQTVYAYKDDTEISAKIGSKKMYINDERKTMDVAPVIVGGRTLVPARFIAEAFGCNVDWDSLEKTVDIKTNNKDEVITQLNDDIIGVYVYTCNDSMFTLIIYNYDDNNISTEIRAVDFSDENTDGAFDAIKGTIELIDNTGYFTYTDLNGFEGSGELSLKENNCIQLKYYSQPNDWSVSYGSGIYEKINDVLGDFEENNIESGTIY